MKIHYISPYRTDKNIGKAINDAIIALKPEKDDFIVHIDQDAMFLLPDSKKQLEEILENTTFDILGPLTNRLAAQTQVLTNMFNETDITKHIIAAKECDIERNNIVIQVNDPLAAFCLCFRVSLWRELGGFAENNIQFDYLFCSRALRDGKRLGVMTGIYVFHLYRMWTDRDPRREIKHLL